MIAASRSLKLEQSSKMWKCLILVIFTLSGFIEGISSNFYSYEPSEQKVIGNLDEYVRPFENCLVHLINYEGVDFNKFEYPVVLSRYGMIMEPGGWERFIFYEEKRYPKKNVTYNELHNSYSWEIRSSRYNWKCLAQFYLLPPDIWAYYGNGKVLSMPMAFKSFWNNLEAQHNFHNVYQNFPGKYHILVKRPRSSYRRWITTLDIISNIGGSHDAMILTVEEEHDNFGNMKITKASLVCQYCDKLQRQLISQEGDMVSFESYEDVQKRFEMLNRYRNDEIPWASNGFEDHSLIDSDENFSVRQTDLNRAVTNNEVTFRNVAKWLGHGLLIQNLHMDLAIPNITISDVYWCIDERNGRCDRGYVAFPSIDMFDNTRFFLQPQETFSFLTCGGEKQGNIDFTGFISAFDMESWLFTVGFYLGTGLFLSIVSTVFLKQSLDSAPFYMGVKVLLEQGDDIASNSQRIGFMYWVGGPWALISIVLSNAYRGQNITDLTAPLKPIGIKTFSELVESNFTIYTRIPEYGRAHDKLKSLITPGKFPAACFNHPMAKVICDIPRGEYHSVVYSKRVDIYHTKTEDGLKAFKFLNETLYEKVQLYPEYERIYDGNITFVDVLKDCNKTAYVGWSKEIDFMESELMFIRPTGHISKGVDPILSREFGWDLKRWMDNRILRRIMALLESGIANEWVLMHDIRKNYKVASYIKRHEINAKPLKLTGNVASVFVVFCVGIAVSIPSIFFELGIYYRFRFIPGGIILLRNRIRGVKQKILRTRVVKIKDNAENMFEALPSNG